MDAMGGYMTASMMQQQESLRQTQETIRRLEMEIAQHEESERSLQQVQARASVVTKNSHDCATAREEFSCNAI
jgi:hypothetical protein